MHAHPPPAAPRRLAGFTLVELMVVLVIGAILGALAVPSFSGLIERQRLQAAAAHLQADIALARQEAGRRGQTVHLVFQPGTHWCYVLSGGIGVDCRGAVRAPGNGVIKVVHAADHPGITLVEATAMAMDHRSGTSLVAEAHARFATPAGLQVQLRVGPLGRASVCAPAAPVGSLPACAGAPPA